MNKILRNLHTPLQNWMLTGSPPSSPSVATRAVHNYKIVMLGVTGSGKTSLVHRFLRGGFIAQLPTIGAAFHKHLSRNADKEMVELQIWDTAG